MNIVILGVLVGAVLGLTGAGGGILGVPALVYGLGWSMVEAAPVALLAVAGAAAIGAIEAWRKRLLRYRAAMLMAAAGIVSTPLGLRAARLAPEPVLLLLFALAMCLVAVRMYRGSGAIALPRDPVCRINPAVGRIRWTPAAFATLSCIGLCAGFLTGLLGVGGGFVIVPALRRVSDISMHGIVATSLGVIAIVAAAAVAAAWLHGATLPVNVALPFVAATALGMVAGRFAGRRLPAERLQRMFALLTTMVALSFVVKALLSYN